MTMLARKRWATPLYAVWLLVLLPSAVGGIAEDHDSIAIPAPHPHVAVAGGEHLVPAGDLIEQARRLRAER